MCASQIEGSIFTHDSFQDSSAQHTIERTKTGLIWTLLHTQRSAMVNVPKTRTKHTGYKLAHAQGFLR